MSDDTDEEFLDSLIGRPITVSGRVHLFALARRGAEAAARIEQLEKALRGLIGACRNGRLVSLGAGGMTIEAQMRNSVYNGISAWAVEEAEAILDALEAKP